MEPMDLLPCPFCGCDEPVTTVHMTKRRGQAIQTRYVVECRRCGGQMHEDAPATLADAVRAWNLRTMAGASDGMAPVGIAPIAIAPDPGAPLLHRNQQN